MSHYYGYLHILNFCIEWHTLVHYKLIIICLHISMVNTVTTVSRDTSYQRQYNLVCLNVILISIFSMLIVSWKLKLQGWDFRRYSSESQYSHNEILIWQKKWPGVGVEERERRGKCKGFPVFNSWDDFMSIFAVVFFSGASGKRWGNLANRIRILYVYSFILCNLMLHPLIWKKLSTAYHIPIICHHYNIIRVFETDLIL